MDWDDPTQRHPVKPPAGLPRSGTVLPGGYRLVVPVGAFGVTYAFVAEDAALDRRVIVRFLLPEHVSATSRQRYVAAARAMARVSHENIASIYAVGEIEGSPYYVMEFVPGSSLADHAAPPAGPLAVDTALDAIDQLCRGLEATHQSGTTHGGLDPSEVHVGPAFRVVTSDVGIARSVPGWLADPVNDALGLRAPELGGLRDDGPIEPWVRVDVYALARIADHLLRGDAALGGPGGSGETLRPPLLAVLEQATRPDPQERIPTVRALRRALADARAGGTTGRERLRVLLVDDDEDFRDLAEACIRSAFPGCELHTCHEGTSALAAAQTHAFDLAVLDLHVPGMNGIELTAGLRSDSVRPKVPILVVTGRGGAADWRVLSALGADGFVVKPVEPAALVAAARRLVAPPRRPL